MKKLQYITDGLGKRVGVILSIEEYNRYAASTENLILDEPEANYIKDSPNFSEPDQSLVETLFNTYSNLPEQQQKALKNLILDHNSEKSHENIWSLSVDSFAEVWNSSENEHWDQFIKDRLNV